MPVNNSDTVALNVFVQMYFCSQNICVWVIIFDKSNSHVTKLTFLYRMFALSINYYNCFLQCIILLHMRYEDEREILYQRIREYLLLFAHDKRRAPELMIMTGRIGWFAIYTALLQAMLILVFMGFVKYDTFYDGTQWNVTRHHGHETPDLRSYYPMFQDIHVMIVIGFGFLMTFLKKYGFSAVGLNLLLTAITIQLAIMVDGIARARGKAITLNIVNIINADFCCGTILISFGAVLGKTSPTQMLLMATLEVIVYTINLYLCIEVLGITDLGGSIVIHTFGAYFGLAFSRTVSRKVNVIEHPNEGSSYVSDIFSMIGTVFLWVYWPSFNGALGNDKGIGRAIINTYLGLAGAVVAAFLTSAWVSRKNQFTMVHIQNATLAGGVAIGSVADLMIQPWGALCIGCTAGLVATLGYIYLQPWLVKKIGLHDSCGVHNLHGMPGLISGVVSIGMSLFASETFYGKDLYVQFPHMSPPLNSSLYLELKGLDLEPLEPGSGRTASQQALCQAVAIFATLVIAILSGALTGLFLSCGGRCEPVDPRHLFSDIPFWELPEDEDGVLKHKDEPGKLFSIQATVPSIGAMKLN
ncbi:ammonium transporter Rh type A-like [Palaemon carinicauda]|uniref:ammonium transporter Rh type A-like n=1 Tax=Palaemon carinicauda TaxID=392227 RepID=UPI0035B61ED9